MINGYIISRRLIQRLADEQKVELGDYFYLPRELLSHSSEQGLMFMAFLVAQSSMRSFGLSVLWQRDCFTMGTGVKTARIALSTVRIV
jgi:hypothetical protein